MAERREIWDSIIKRSQKVAASVAKQAQTIAQTAQKKTVQTVDAVKVENQIKKPVRSCRKSTRCWDRSFIRSRKAM